MRGEAGKKAERANETGIVGVGLISAEFALGEVVDIGEVGTGALSKPELSHDGALQRAVERRRECRPEYRW